MTIDFNPRDSLAKPSRKKPDIGALAAPLQAFSPATEEVVTRRRRASKPRGPDLRNPKLSREQRLAILQERYPEAPEKLLEAIANKYRTPHAFAKALQKKEPLQSRGMDFAKTRVQLYEILRGEFSGWNRQREPHAIIKAAANLTGWPVDEFVPVLNDGERLDDLRRHYPNANDALLQVIVPFKTCLNFTRQLPGVGDLEFHPITLRNRNARLHDILKRRFLTDLKQKKEPDGSLRPNDMIMAVAAFTGLDHRYFLRPKDGGIPLKRGERIAYDRETGKYSIISAAPKAAQKPFSSAAKQVTRRARKPRGPSLANPDLSPEECLAILKEHYPKARKILLKEIAEYNTPHAFAKAICQHPPLASEQADLTVISAQLNRISAQLNSILTGKVTGLTKRGEPVPLFLAAANLTSRPVDDFVRVLDDGKRLDDLRRRYPKANDALLQVMVPFKTCLDFVRKLLENEPLKFGAITPNNVRVRLNYILTRRFPTDLKQKREPDGTRQPNDIIMAVAALTGLDHRYFLRPEDGGIPLKRGERIDDRETGKYSIIGTAPKAAPQFPGLAA